MILKIREQKNKNMWSVLIMTKLLLHASMYEFEDTIMDGGRPTSDMDDDDLTRPYEIISGSAFFSSSLPDLPLTLDSYADVPDERGGENFEVERKETAVLIATKNGIIEMVETILSLFPVAINDMTKENKNVVLLAVEHRQLHLFELFRRKKVLKDNVFQHTDNDGNNALHLAAMLQETNPWPVPGATLQMQWEIKWFKFIKELFSDINYHTSYNKKGETPEDVFAKAHKDLVQDSATWLNNVSQACSVVAGLFVTIAFNTSVTVPGGTNQETGTPYLENQPSFNVFAISSQVAFYSSVFSVVMFLAILTSGYQTSDLNTTLPWKLLLGVTTLYISIASTLASFCSAHFFILKAKLKHAASPVYIVTFLVVTLLAIANFPLYFQLVWATFKMVPQRRGKMVITQNL